MLKLESEGAMFFLGKYVYSQIPEKWQKKSCKTCLGAHFWHPKKRYEIFAARVLQIHFAIKKTDPGDKLCRAGSKEVGIFFKLLWGDYLAHNIHSQKATDSEE